MTSIRNLAAATAVGLIAVSTAPHQAAAAPKLTPEIEQRTLAQLGLGYGFMARTLQTQLNILDQENNGKVGVCVKLVDGGSIKLKSRTGTFSTKAVVDIYYDNACKNVYIDAQLTFNEDTSSSVIVSEKATLRDLNNNVMGTLSMKAEGARTNGSVVNFAGGGIWQPSNGAKVLVGLKCNYFSNLGKAVGKAFNCSFGIAQSFSDLALDIGSLAQMKITVAKVKNGTTDYNGTFNKSPAQVYLAAKGGLKVTGSSKGVAVSGGTQVSAPSLSGLSRLTVFWPPQAMWTVDDGQQKFDIAMDANLVSTATITAVAPGKAPTFAVDKAGNMAGTFKYSDGKKSKIINWLLSE